MLGEKHNQQIHMIVLGVLVSAFEEGQANGSCCWQILVYF